MGLKIERATRSLASRCLCGVRIMPAAIRSNQRLRVLWPPGAAFVRANPAMRLEHTVDHRPGGFNSILACEQRSVASHGVAQEPFVGRFFARLFIGQIKLALFSDELLPSKLHASGKGHRGIR